MYTFSETKTACEQTEPGWNNQQLCYAFEKFGGKCDYGEEQDNQVRDIVILHVTIKELKSKST